MKSALTPPLLTAISLLFLDGGRAFQPSLKHQQRRCAGGGDALHCKAGLPSRRRDFVSLLTTTVVVATAPPRRPALATPGGIALNYNGVYDDPTYPNGYRVLIGSEDSRTVALTLQNEYRGEACELPVQITEVATVAAGDGKKEVKQFAFDFGPIGGPSNVTGAFSRDIEGTPVISFSNGTTWTKRETGGPSGVYRDGFDPQKIIVVREKRGNRQLAVRLIEGDGTITIRKGKAGMPISVFCLQDGEGKGRLDEVLNVPGVVNTKKETISFDDGNVWTKF